MLSALAESSSKIDNPSIAGDCIFLENALRLCGVSITKKDGSVFVDPDPLIFPDKPINCGDGGTTFRFLASLSLLSDQQLALEVQGSMKNRPVSGLLKSLESLGVKIIQGNPVRLQRQSVKSETFVDTSETSQYLSSLMLVSPSRNIDTIIRYGSNPVSDSYISMTERCLEYYKINFKHSDFSYYFKPERYRGIDISVEPDASASALFEVFRPFLKKEFKLVSGNTEFVPSESIQGDSILVNLLEQYYSGKVFEFEISKTPDLIVPLTISGLLGLHPVNLKGISHTYLKESSRPVILKRELEKIGGRVDIYPDEMTVYPGFKKTTVVMDPSGDHRLAMAFGFLSIVSNGISVKNMECTVKSFPGFFTELEKIR